MRGALRLLICISGSRWRETHYSRLQSTTWRGAVAAADSWMLLDACMIILSCTTVIWRQICASRCSKKYKRWVNTYVPLILGAGRLRWHNSSPGSMKRTRRLHACSLAVVGEGRNSSKDWRPTFRLALVSFFFPKETNDHPSAYACWPSFFGPAT